MTPPPLPLPESSELEQAANLEAAAAAEKAPVRQRLAQALRYLGVSAVVLSGITYLCTGVTGEPPLIRYFYFLAMTVVMAGAGLFCLRRWNDETGARVFFLLGVATFPAHFAQLGAQLYAEMKGKATGSVFSGPLEVLQFGPEGGLLTFGVTLASLGLLWLVGRFAFSAMVRPAGRALNLAYIGSCALLLLPFRGVLPISLVLGAALALYIWADRRWMRSGAHWTTFEGRFARLLLTVPLFVLIGRSLLLHERGVLLGGISLSTLAVLQFCVLPNLLQRCWSRELSRIFGLLSVGMGVGLFGLQFNWLNADTAFLTWLMPVSVLTFLLSFCFERPMRVLRSFAAGGFLFAAQAQMWLFGGAWIGAFSFIASLVVVAVAFSVKEKGVFALGLVALVFSTVHHLGYLWELGAVNGWLLLGGAGIVAMLVASFLDKRSSTALARWQSFRTRLEAWN